jgi:hypothetical protein
MKRLATLALVSFAATSAHADARADKFSFTGDRYKITDRTFLTEAKAYAGCR